MTGSKLGLEVPPGDVRILPRKEDAYRWSVLPQKEHLFEKNLSKLSTGVYTQLMQGIGVFFEALPKEPLHVTHQGPIDTAEKDHRLSDTSTLEDRGLVEDEMPEANFMAHITQLQSEVTLLQAEARQWQKSAETEGGQRAKLEGELERAKTAFLALRKESIGLRRDCQKARRQSDQLKVKADAWDRDVRQLMGITHRLAAVSGTPPLALPGDDAASDW